MSMPPIGRDLYGRPAFHAAECICEECRAADHKKSLLATIRQQAERIERLELTVFRAGTTFREYAALHRAKGTAEGNRKADANERCANDCFAALCTRRTEGDEAVKPEQQAEQYAADEYGNYHPNDSAVVRAGAKDWLAGFRAAGQVDARHPPSVDQELLDAERSSAFEAATVLLKALGWSAGGLGSAAIEIVKQRDEARAALEAQSQPRPCTCHPSERPAVCQRKYALSECLQAAGQPLEPRKLADNALIDAAQARAALYDDDDRQDIKTDVMNAFFAGAKFGLEGQSIAAWSAELPTEPGWYWAWYHDEPEILAVERQDDGLMFATGAAQPMQRLEAFKGFKFQHIPTPRTSPESSQPESRDEPKN